MKKNTKELVFERKRLLLTEIKEDDALLMRVRLDDGAIEEYGKKYVREKSGSMQKGEAAFPLAEVVTLPDGTHVLVHGRHRFNGMKRATFVESDFMVARGTIEQAAMYAAKANLTASSVRYTHADKQHAVSRLLAIMPKASSRVIATCCGVHHSTVEKYREKSDGERKGADGRPVPPKRPKNSGENSQSSPTEASSGGQQGGSDMGPTANDDPPGSSGAPHEESATVGSDLAKGNGAAMSEAEIGPDKEEKEEEPSKANPPQPTRQPSPAARTIVLPSNGIATRITVDGRVRVASVTASEVIIEVLAEQTNARGQRSTGTSSAEPPPTNAHQA